MSSAPRVPEGRTTDGHLASVFASSLGAVPNGEVLATTMAALSLVVATASVGWNIAAWRRSGPVLRVQALLFDDLLEVRVFNAGRTAESLEAVVLGGLRHGRKGLDLSEALGCPRVLGPGESIRVPVDWQQLAAPGRRRLLRAGWESLWLLRGSMREQRVDVLPVGEPLPEGAGWRLAPRRSSQTRYVPLIMAVPLFAIGFDAPSHAGPVWIFFAIAGLVVGYRIHTALVRPRPSWRRRVENTTVVAGALAVLVGWLSRADLTYSLVAYLTWAALLALPGAVAGMVLEARTVADRWRDRATVK